jgi:ABC-type glycerol-3-phosphate transport system substrate-binding protein
MGGIMFRKLNRKTLAIGAVLLLAAAGAYAYWTSGGTGSGSAATGTTTGITVTQTTTPTGLVPGGPTKPLAGKFNNTNDGPVRVNQVNATISSVTGPNITGPNPCTAADYQLNGFPVTVGVDVPSGTAVGDWSGASIQMLNTASNQDGCKGATVNIAYTSN